MKKMVYIFVLIQIVQDVWIKIMKIANILIQVLDNYPKISKIGSDFESGETVEKILYLLGLGKNDGDFPGCLPSSDMKKIASFDKRLKNGW